MLRRTALLVGWLVAAAGCEEKDPAQARSEWNALVARSNECSSADDCVAISPGCPLACWAAVNKREQASVLRAAGELIDDTGRRCEYRCPAATPILCEEGACVLTSPDAGTDAGTAADGG
jgi:hypothetical protein